MTEFKTPQTIQIESIHNTIAILSAIFVFSAYIYFGTQNFTSVPGWLTDNRFNNIVLEHLYLWSIGVTEDIWSPDYFYPYPDALTFSDNHFGSGALYVAARHLGVEREIAFTIWHFSGYALSWASMYWVLRRFRFSVPAASVAAIVFAFSITMLIRTEHSQLVYRFASPLAVYFAWRLVESGRLRYVGLTALFASWQFLCSVYIGLFLVMLLLGVLPGLFLFKSSRTYLLALPRTAFRPVHLLDIFWLICGILVTTLTLLMLMRYASTANMYGFGRSSELILSQLPRLDSYIRADNSALYRSFASAFPEGPYWHERQLFIGGLAFVLLSLSILPRQENERWRTPFRALVFSAFILFVLTLRSPIAALPSLYSLVADVPGFNAVRAPARIITVMLIPIAFMAAVGYDRATGYLRRYHGSLAIAFALACGTFAVIETATTRTLSVPLETHTARKADILQHLPRDLADDAILVYRERSDPESEFLYSDIDAIVVAQELRLRTLNGYSGNFPRGYRAMNACTDIKYPLAGGAYYGQRPSAEMNDILDRLVLLDFSADCAKTDERLPRFTYEDPMEVFSHAAVPREALKDIRLAIETMDVVDGFLRAGVRIENSSEHLLPGNFGSPRFNVRFSWQFRADTDGGPQATEWLMRFPLNVSVAPGESEVQMLNLLLPDSVGRYRLNLTMVQEELNWFHDYGFEPLAADQVIQVGPNNGTQILDAESLESTTTIE